MAKTEDMTIGSRFGDWRVTSKPFLVGFMSHVRCRCRCGKFQRVRCSCLRLGYSVRCAKCAQKMVVRQKRGEE